MFTDQAPSWLKSEQDDGDRVLPVATQPALQLSLDVVMQENYGGTLAAHAGTGAWAGGVGGDGWFRNGAAFEPVYNCPGAFAWKGTPDAHLASMWLGVIDAGMYSDLNFIYTEAEYDGPVYPGESTASDAWQLAEQQAVFAEHVAYLKSALAAPFGTEHPAVRAFPAEIRARAWAVPDRGALNCSTILAVVNTNETRAHDVSLDFDGWAGGSATRLYNSRACAPSSSDGHAVSLGDTLAPGAWHLYCLKDDEACA